MYETSACDMSTWNVLFDKNNYILAHERNIISGKFYELAVIGAFWNVQ